MEWIQKKIDEYCSWLKDNTIVHKDLGTEWYALSTPFVGFFNDHINIYVKREDGNIILSDDGETLENLSLCGVELGRSEKRRNILNSILNTHGIKIEGTELLAIASNQDFPIKKHALVSAIMNICDLEVLATNKVSNLFSEDVQSYLDSKEIIYSPSIFMRGVSGLDYNFNFQLAGRESEAVIKTFDIIKQDYVTSLLYGLSDVKKNRVHVTSKKFISIVFVNDGIKEPSSKLMNILEENDVYTARWSDKEKMDEILKQIV